MNSSQHESYSQTPEPPDEPLPSDCCGTGCIPCVFDIYEEDLKRWKKECQRLLGNGDPSSHAQKSGSVLSTSEFRDFKLEHIQQVTADSFVYRFTIPGEKSLGLKVGQHLILRLTRGYLHADQKETTFRGTVDGKVLTRQYTPISSLDCTGSFEVLIKIYQHGKMSCFISTWKIGDIIEWRGPFGQFTYIPNKFTHMCMLAAGTGIAPMIQVIQEILDNEEEDTSIKLLYACQTYDHLLLKDKLDQRTDHWNFNVLYCISKEDGHDQSKVRYGDQVHYGRIDQDLLARELPSPSDNIQVLICGTKSFDKDMIKYLLALGFLSSMYYKF